MEPPIVIDEHTLRWLSGVERKLGLALSTWLAEAEHPTIAAGRVAYVRNLEKAHVMRTGDVVSLIEQPVHEEQGVLGCSVAEAFRDLPRVVRAVRRAAVEDGRSKDVRIAAIGSLLTLGADGVTPAVRTLRQIAETEQDLDLRVRAVNAIGFCRVEINRSETLLANLLKSQHEPDLLRGEAASALGHLGSQGAARHLSAALGDRSRAVRRDAALALGSLGDARARAPLRALAEHASMEPGGKELAETAREMLASIGEDFPDGR